MVILDRTKHPAKDFKISRLRIVEVIDRVSNSSNLTGLGGLSEIVSDT